MNQIGVRFLSAVVVLLAMTSVPAAASEFIIQPAIVSTTLRWSVQIGTETAQIDPTLYLQRGQTYSFTVNTSTSHPFYFKTVKGSGSADAYPDGVSVALPVTNGTPFTFDVPDDAPDSLFYDCSVHSSMAGNIKVVVFRNGFD